MFLSEYYISLYGGFGTQIAQGCTMLTESFGGVDMIPFKVSCFNLDRTHLLSKYDLDTEPGQHGLVQSECWPLPVDFMLVTCRSRSTERKAN